MKPEYAELRCRSNFSFLRGASHPAELVERAHSLQYSALALTDQDGLHGMVRAHEAARKQGSRLIIGSHVTVGEGAASPLVLLVENATGYRNLCQLITLGRLREAKGSSRVEIAEVAAHAAGLTALHVGDPLSTTLQEWRDIFPDRLFLGTWRHRQPEDARRNAAVEREGARLGAPRVALGDVHVHVRSHQPLQDVMTCIRLGKTVREAGRQLMPNAERTLRSREELGALFRDRPEWLRTTLEVAERCDFSLDALHYEFPSPTVPSGELPGQHLRARVMEGAEARYRGRIPENVRAQIVHELTLIESLGYAGYFLCVWDIMRFARSRGILCQGRGSAANSVVCYALGITAIDPVRMDLLFERFVSAERGEPPDIDVDFENSRREEVLQYVYEKHGRDHAAMVCEVITYRRRSAIREVGKALGLSLDQVGRLSRVVSRRAFDSVQADEIREVGVDPEDPGVQQLFALASQLEGAPRHLGIHSGGFVITEGALPDLVPLENASMTGRTVVQWDKTDLEALGILKIDLLGLGMLSVIRRAFEMVSEHGGGELSLDTLPPEDPAVYEAISQADTLGMFQIESRAQMSMLPRLRPRSFYDLVVEIALVRPGPIQGDMVHPYLRRRQGMEPIQYPHPEVHRILKRTYGVPLFQEQVMRIAVAAGGFSPGEADELRRAMKAWRLRSQMGELASRLIMGLKANGMAEEQAQRIFDQIQGFGEYGFPESHAASFAIIVYASAFLRVHHRAAFTASLLNSQPMGFYSPSSIVADAVRHGLEVLPVDALVSHWEATLERKGEDFPDRDGPPPHAVRLGFAQIRRMRREEAERLIRVRSSGGLGENLVDLASRTGLPRTSLMRLAAANAFRGLGLTRREATWQIQGLPHVDLPLLARALETPSDVRHLPEASRVEEMLEDHGAMGLSLEHHPVGMMRDGLQTQGVCTAQALRKLSAGRSVHVAGMVITRQRPGTARGVLFLTLEDETGHVNVVVWKKTQERYRVLVRDEVLLRVRGRVEREGSVVHVIAHHFEAMELTSTPSRHSVRSYR